MSDANRTDALNKLSRRAESIAKSDGLGRMAAWAEAIRRNPKLAAVAGRGSDTDPDFKYKKPREPKDGNEMDDDKLRDGNDELRDEEDDDEQKNCSNCGKFLGQGDSYCRSCGAEVPDDDDDDEQENPTRRNDGRRSSAPSGVAALHSMEQKVQAIVAASGGRISKPQAYAQLLASPEGRQLYRRYEDEREEASLTRAGRAGYVRAMHSLMQSAGYGTMPSGITDNLPERK
jgi:hypothetical protein